MDPSASNVVPLHPDTNDQDLLSPTDSEIDLRELLDSEPQSWGSAPSTVTAARERRRHVLFALTGFAITTLLVASAVGGIWTALHIAADAALVGYVVLLVRVRQIEAERRAKVEPIRPPVTDVAPTMMQPAPSYLVRSGT